MNVGCTGEEMKQSEKIFRGIPLGKLSEKEIKIRS